METPTLVIFLCVFLFSQTGINGKEVELKVKPGENITLYCDRSLTTGLTIVWIRNCSHKNQPSLLLDNLKWGLETFQDFNFVYNSYNNSYDLHIPNISVSDLGLYYCAEVETKINNDKKGLIFGSKVYHYGKQITRLSLAESTSCSSCVFCWTLLFSVCPACVLLSSLLSSICVYCFCRPQTTGSEWSAEILTADFIKGNQTEEHQCEASKTGRMCVHTEVSYRLMKSENPKARI